MALPVSAAGAAGGAGGAGGAAGAAGAAKGAGGMTEAIQMAFKEMLKGKRIAEERESAGRMKAAQTESAGKLGASKSLTDAEQRAFQGVISALKGSLLG